MEQTQELKDILIELEKLELSMNDKIIKYRNKLNELLLSFNESINIYNALNSTIGPFNVT